MASLTDMDFESSALYRNPKPTTIDLVGGIYCHICHITYANKREYDMHYVKHQTGSKDIIYTCVVCHKEIAGYPSFRGHCYTSHVIKERFKCEHCSKLFSKSPSLKEHINVMHRFKCSSCKKEFTSKKELQLHQIIHNNTDMPPFKCQACYNQIDSLEGCKDHVDLHSASIYFCPICNENISSRENAKEHLKKHFGDDGNNQQTLIAFDKGESYIEQLGGISCKYCPLIFKDRVEFDAHFSCEHGNEDIVYTCNVCGKEFEKYSVFSDHSYNHFMKDRFCCDICHKTFSRLSLLVTHMSACQANIESNGKPFACHQCGHRYATEMRLREHLRDVHNIHCVFCPENGCQKIFSTPKDLINHQREHHSQQNWCRQCGLLFPTLQSCERHLDLHKKKLYVCPICNRNYGEKYLILKHVPQHFESVLHLCKVCGKVYNAKNRLIEHIKTHSETKSHTCTYCGKGFVKIAQLQQHLNIHTGSKPYKCPICSKSFASYPNWHKHMRRMHEVDGKKFKKETDKASNIIDDSESDSVDNLDGEESPTDIELKENNAKQLTTEILLDQVDTFPKTELHVGISDAYVSQERDDSTITSPKTELHVGISDAYVLQEPDDSTMESDSIDQIITEKELEIFKDAKNENMKNIFEFINVLPNNNTPTLVSGKLILTIHLVIFLSISMNF
ncbi:zinc finger protein 624-like [Melitaea cinxia]|uniref:zinc finger protein 624-like n=1 Tax=Melitaea cinxia TaxID=113334 RepID=UPI001E26FEF2|nr:zinc finger protein 624-like [Melitaea cinxia]